MDNAIETEYRYLMKGHLRYDVKQTGQLGDILHEFYRMTSGDLQTPVVRLDEEYLTLLVRNLFTEQKANLRTVVAKPIEQGKSETAMFVNLPTRQPSRFQNPQDMFGNAFYEFGKNYLIRVLQYKLDELANKKGINFSIDELVTDQVWANGFKLFTDSHQISLNQENNNEVLEKAKKIFSDSIKESEVWVLNFLIWKTEATSNEFKFINFLINHIVKASYSKDDYENEYNLMIHKLLIFVDFYRRITIEEKSYDIIYFIGKEFLQKNHNWSTKNGVFTTILTGQLLTFFLKTSDSGNLKKGKEIFVSYFTDFSKYSQPTSAYKKFIQNRYKRRGINFEFNFWKTEHERMNRLQIIDILHCSIYMEKELLSRKDLYKIFQSFGKYSVNFDFVENGIFVSLRNMMIIADNTVNDLPVFFDSLYDSFLQATQYYAYVERENLDVFKNAPILYDDYVDYIWKRKNNLWKYVSWIWLPDYVHFPLNINENYIFFKLINLATNIDALSSQKEKFEFCNFQYQNNYWIHKYTTTPMVRRLINFIRVNKLYDQGFNYKILAGQSLDLQFMLKLSQYIRNEEKEI